MNEKRKAAPIFGYSHRHGAANCEWNVAMNRCDPARETFDTWNVSYVPSEQMELPL